MNPEIPSPIEAHYPYGQPNEPVTLYSGPLDVSTQIGSLTEPFGKVRLEWVPTPRVRFEIPVDKLTAFQWFASEVDDSVVSIPDLEKIPSPPGNPNTVDDGSPKIDGFLNSKRIGDGRMLSSVTFQIVNFPRVAGTGLKKDGNWWRGRLSWESDSWSMILDSRSKCDALVREVRRTGGYAVTYTGEIRRLDGAMFSTSEARELLHMLRTLLSFSSGRWVTPMLPVGFDENGIAVWSDWSRYRLTPWTGSYRPLDANHVEQYREAFELASKSWSDPFRRHVIQSSINYFVDGNKADPLELAISALQAGLELLAWTELVEEQGIYTSRQYKARQAHKNITELLNRHQVDTSIPGDLTSLAAVAQAENCKSGPEVITRMRNSIIHPKHGRQGFDIDAWFQAWNLAKQYLVLAMLAFLGYKGKYRDPLNGDKSMGAISAVPWAP